MGGYWGEYQAAMHLLTYPSIARRTAPFRPRRRRRGIDWAEIERAAGLMSTTEQLLIEAAFGLWRGTGGDLGRLANRLDDGPLARVIEAIWLYRGDRPDLARYPEGG
jgi:hypothetical protein